YDRRVGRVVIALSSGLELAFPPSAVQGLEHARPADLVDAQISLPDWASISPSSMQTCTCPRCLRASWGSRRWMAAEMGRRGGASASAEKAAAARRNGRLGGRPRKITAQA
ncbi:hypothetical protein AWV80_33420, partial [Cupriavidus sp. UYMU48A]